MPNIGLKLMKFSLLAGIVAVLSGCSSSSSGAIDQLLGNAKKPPILNSIADQNLQQTDTFSADVNNIQKGQPGTDEGMSYACFYDNTVDGDVSDANSCASFPHATVTFESSTGKLQFTPDANVLGNYEFKITGTNSEGKYDEIFVVGVRLKFNGVQAINSITGTSATISWVQPPAAVGYQIFKLNTSTGDYELFRTLLTGAISGTTITGLTPNTGYTIRVQAVDSLGYTDGNVVSKSFTTTELVQFAMSPATVTVASGTSQAITVRAFNADGSPQTVGGLTLVPSIASGTSTGNFSAVVDNNDGTYSFNFTPVTVGSAISIDVSINMTFFLQNTVAMTVIHGPPSNTQSTLTLSSNTVISGQNITVQALIRDANNNPIDSGSTIAFSKSGGSSTGTFGAVVNAGGGFYTTTYTGVTAGSAQTIRVSVDGTMLTLSGSIQVLPGAPTTANSTLTIGSSSISSGTSTTVTATLRDVNSNPVPSGILVTFSKAGGTSTGSFSSVVNAGSGVYTTTYDGLQAGTAQTINVLVDGNPLALSVTVAVVPGAPVLANSSLSVSAPTVVSDSFVTVSGTLKDINNNPVDSGITVSFSKTGGSSTGTFGTVNNQGGGLYTVRYTGVLAGSAQTLRVLVNGVDLGATVTIQVLPGAPSATTSTITVGSATILSGASTTITATLKDAQGNVIPSGVLVGISKTGGTSTGTLSSVTNAGSGVYTATYQGIVAGSAQTIGILADGSALGPTTTLQVLVGAADPANSSLTITSNTVVSGQFVTVTAMLKDLNNNPITSGIAVAFGKSGGTATGTFGSVTNVGDGSYTVRYTGVGAGTSQTVIVTLNGTDLGKTVLVAVTPGAPSATTSTISVSSGTVASGASVTVTTTIRDDNNNAISSGVLVGFSKSGGTSTGNFGTVTNAGNGQYTTTYTGVTAGSAQTLGVSVDSVALGITTTITVIPGAPNVTLTTLDITSGTVVAGNAVTVTLTLRDGNSNPISSGYVIGLTATGGTSTGVISATTNQGNGVYTTTYTGDVAGTSQTLQATVNAGGFGPTQSIQVLVGYPSLATSSLTVSPSTVASGTSRTISAVIKDVRGNPITNQYSITFDASGGTSTGTLGAVNNAGSGNFNVSYTGVVSGSAQTVRVLADGNIISGLSGTIQVVPGAVDTTNSSFSISATTVQSGTNATLNVSLRDVNSNRIYGRTVTFNKNSTAGSNGTISASTESGTPVNSGNYSATYTASQQGAAQTLTLVVDGTAVPAMTTTVTVISGPPAQLSVSAPATPFNTTVCVGPFTVGLLDAAGNSTVSLSTVSLTLSSPDTDSDGIQDHVGNVFSDSSCLTDLTTLDIPAGVNSASFYYRNYLPVSYTLTFVPPAGITSNSTTMYTQPVISWIGSAMSGSTMSGSGQGFVGTDVGTGFGFVDPLDLVIYGNYLYVSDRGSYRIMKFDLSTSPYTYLGWVGYIESTEGISAACSGQSAGQWTADWCTGGRAQAIQSMNVLYGLGADATYVYAATDHRVLRIQQSNGANMGWIGRVSTTLPSSCTGGTPTTNNVTPGWCTGGTYTSGTADGHFNSTTDVTVMGGKLYVVDSGNHRIQRWSAAGVFEGWIGNVNEGTANGAVVTSPDAAYATGCANANTNDFTPGFCTGAAAQAQTRRNWSVTPENPIPGEGFSSPIGITNDGTYLYLADQNNARIARINIGANPIAVTWIGFVLRNTATNPTVPAQTNSTYTTTWVSGGSTQERSDGLGHYPTNIVVDGASMYFTDIYMRAMKVNTSDGQSRYHIGRVSSSPSGGAAGCSSTPTMGITPGWCTGGGYNRFGAGNAAFSEARGVDVYGTDLFVIDRFNFRIQRINKNTGVFVGWMGAIAVNQDSWTMTAPNSFARRGWNNQSFWDISGQFSTMAISGNYLYVPDYAAPRIKRYNKRVGTFGGYVGTFDIAQSFLPTGPDACLGITSGMTPDWCTGGGKMINSSAVHGYNGVSSVTSDGTYIYVASTGNARVDRFNKDTTLYGGWIGRTNGVPTDGDANCTTTISGQKTPGWCIGGSAQGSGGGVVEGAFLSNLHAIYYDSNNSKLYATDSSRLIRIDPTSGLSEGSIGNITGASTCTLTNGVPNIWCTAATAVGSGTDNYGGLNEPMGIWSNSTDIFVADSGNSRIHRFTKSSGAPNGFIGRQNANTGLSLTGNCLGATGFPRALPGWCMGTSVGVALGTAQTGTGSGDFSSPRGIWGDATYLYIADSGNNRIVRILISDGSFQGWKGAIATTTGMSTQCQNDAATVGYTQRWCTGGTSVNSTKMGGFNTPVGVTGDANYLYIHDGKNNRLVTIPKN